MTTYPTVAIPIMPVDLTIGYLGDPQDVTLPNAHRRWLRFRATVILAIVGLAVTGAVLSFILDVLGLLAVSGFLLFFAGAIALATQQKLRRSNIASRDNEQGLARVIPRSE